MRSQGFSVLLIAILLVQSLAAPLVAHADPSAKSSLPSAQELATRAGKVVVGGPSAVGGMLLQIIGPFSPMLFIAMVLPTLEAPMMIAAAALGLMGVMIPLGILTYAIGFALRDYGATKFYNAFRPEQVPEKSALQHITHELTRLWLGVTFQTLPVSEEFAKQKRDEPRTSDCP